jgi:hypothetical protein
VVKEFYFGAQTARFFCEKTEKNSVTCATVCKPWLTGPGLLKVEVVIDMCSERNREDAEGTKDPPINLASLASSRFTGFVRHSFDKAAADRHP